MLMGSTIIRLLKQDPTKSLLQSSANLVTLLAIDVMQFNMICGEKTITTSPSTTYTNVGKKKSKVNDV